MHLFLKLTNLIANNCEMALVKNAARNGAVCYHHDSKETFVLLCLFLPQGPTLYRPTLRYVQKNNSIARLGSIQDPS